MIYYRRRTTTESPSGPWHDQRLWRNPLPRHEVKRHALDEGGEHELRLHHGEVITRADVRPSAEGEIGRARVFAFEAGCRERWYME